MVILDSSRGSTNHLQTALAITAGLSFVFTGLVALHRRPENRTGVYLAGVGFLWFLGALQDASGSVLFTIGQFVGSFVFVPFAALVLSYPTGRLDRAGRAVVWTTFWFVLVWPVMLLFEKKPSGCSGGCPDSAVFVTAVPVLARTMEVLDAVIPIGLCAAAVVLLMRKWRSATAPARKVLLPVYASGGAALLLLLLENLLSGIAPSTNSVFGFLFVLFFAAVPFAFLFGILQSRLARGSVAGLMVSLEHGEPLRAAIAEALGDPSLALAFWLEDGGRWVDRDGRPLNLSLVPDQTITVVERDGHRIAALLHDESLSGEAELVESVSAAVAFALDNERLQTELRIQNERLLTVMRAAPSLLVTVGLDGRIRRLNPATVEASGFQGPAEVEGRYFWDVFIDPGERRAMVARFRAAAPDHRAAEYENTFTNARGETRSIIWRGAPIHDETGAVESIVAAGLDVTEHRRQEEEIRASRGRIVAAGDEERRRLERNLHDGAQQRLVSLSLALRLAQAKLDSDPAAVPAILAGASDELSLALEELRELARGIHPAVLTDRGLDAALEGLAARTPLAFELERLGCRLPEPIEAAAYYVVSEAVTNVVKHAGATCVRVAVEAVNGHVAIEVADDGVGGAERSGSGLRGLADRLDALEGRLTVESEAGKGTRVLAEIPLPVGARGE